MSLIGFLVSAYLYYSKTSNKKIYCILGKDCDEVVRSKYGETFGMENTLAGIIYYGLVFFYGVALLLNRNLFKGAILYYSVVIASIASVIFSIYLMWVQAFVLKKWCEYCIVSTIISVLILILLVI